MNLCRHLFRAFLLIICCSTALMGAKIWDYFHLDNNQGMSNSSVNVIFQDRTGVVWIGTWDGLNRYDGNHFTQYHSITGDATTLSHPVIRDIQEEDSLYLWIVSDWGLNRFNKRSGQSRRYFLNSPKTTHFAEHTFKCAINNQGQVIGNFANGPLYLFNKEAENFQPLKMDKAPQEPVMQINFESNRQLWIVTHRYLYRYAFDGKAMYQKARIAWRNECEKILFDNDGNIWGQSGSKVLKLDQPSRAFQAVWSTSDKLLSVCRDTRQRYFFGTDNGYYIHTLAETKHFLSDIAVTSLCRGTQDILWVGTDGRGIYQCYAKTKYINSYPTGKKNLPVRCILQDKEEILVGTKGEGLLVYQRLADNGLKLLQSLNVGAGRSYNAVFSLCKGVGADRRIWVGTDGVGLSYYRNGRLYPMRFRSSDDRKEVFSIYSIVAANDSTLYIGTSGNGLLRVNYRGDTVTRVHVYNSQKATSLQSDIVYAQVLDKPFLWLGTRGGGLIRLDTRNQRITAYRSNAKDHQSLVSNDVISLYKDTRKRLWIGTTQGLDILDTGSSAPRFTHVGTEGKLRNINIHSIQEDLYHNIWISTSNGIARIQRNLTFTSFTHKDGLQGDEFSDGAGMSADHGREIYFGGTNGFSIIHPALIQSNGFMPKLMLNSLKIDNAQMPLSAPLRVSHDAKSLELSFSVLDYLDNDRCELSYKLIRRRAFLHDDDSPWINVGNTKTIFLNELPSGNYTLYARQSNAAHQWSQTYLSIPIHISYPVWGRWWAVLLYIAAIILVIRLIYKAKKRRLQRRHQREMEHQRQHNRENIHHAKLRFFANVTGKFSNNITQIYDALEHIRDRKGYEGNLSPELLRIDEHIRQMSLQIKQMSEIQSAEENTQALIAERTDLTELLKITIDSFSASILEKDINLDIINSEQPHYIVTDKTVLSKIVYNLAGYIMHNIQAQSDFVIRHSGSRPEGVEIRLSYQGTSPKSDDFSDIFNSYKALDNFENNMSAGKDDPTIGLTLGNDLAKRMGGSVSIQKDDELHTTFIVKVLELKEVKTGKEQERKPQTPLERILSNKDKSILVIEQDPRMAQFIRDILDSQYNIITCTDETELGSILHTTIDLVVYDMEGSDLALIDAIRANAHTQYAPIIAICNEGEKDSNVNILQTGANAILEKPFHTSFLKALVDRNIQEAARLKEFSASPSAYIRKFDSKDMTEESRRFLLAAVRVVSEHYADENYNPTLFAQDLAVSRSQLYRKLKTIINMSPNDFIIEYRMRHAERMLRSSSKTISEIISLCGFRNRAFFYREFAKRYNCLPKEFRQKKEE